MIRDREPNFTASFDAVFQATGTTILRTAVQVPRMNTICERLVGTLRRELLDRMLILSAAHLRAALTEYQAHYHTAPAAPGHRPARPPAAATTRPGISAADLDAQRVRRRPVLSSLINEYMHAV